jgi:hypothetical protein
MLTDSPYEMFIERVYASYEHPANTKNIGQVFFTKLNKERPAIASRIKDTMFDPRKSDFLHPKIVDTVRLQWEEEDNLSSD